MNKTNIKKEILPKVVIVTTAALITVYLLSMILVGVRMDSLESSTRLLIAEQETTLVGIAETTARNGADAVTESIVRDCSITEREEFDALLGQLNTGLQRQELTSLERLFGRCGSFYSQRKAVMVARLAREIEVYESYVAQLSTIIGKDVSADFKVQLWQSLASEERKQSELFAELVAIQDQIITALLDGESPATDSLRSILQGAREKQEALFYASSQAGKIRSELVPL
jgi:hypothetical protein